MILSMAVTAYLTAGIFYLGYKKAGYNHFKHTISELGETGSGLEKQVGFGLFLPVGIGLLVIAFINWDHEIVRGLSACLAVGYLVAAFFPCDKGSPTSGTWKQQVHNLGGFIEYAGAIYFLMKAGEYDLFIFGIDFKINGIFVLVCVIITSIPGNPVRGLAQRLAELLLFGVLIYLT
jgi:Protein of unknown function (DUF998)